MKVRVHIGDHNLTFTSERARHYFFEHHKGKHAFLVIDDQPSANMRRYFEGAVVPYVFYQHPHGGWADFGECREALKLEFLPKRTVHDLRAYTEHHIAPSTADLTKAQFSAFMEHILNWMGENGLTIPDPDEFTAWRDSAPVAGEEFPPLLQLRAKYDTMKGN